MLHLEVESRCCAHEARATEVLTSGKDPDHTWQYSFSSDEGDELEKTVKHSGILKYYYIDTSRKNASYISSKPFALEDEQQL